MEHWSSDNQELTLDFPCDTASERDVNTTMSASQYIVASYSTLFYLVLLILSILGVCFKPCVKIFTSQATYVLFLIGALMVFVNTFTNSNNLVVKIYFRLFTGFLVGIAFMIFGAVLLFSKPEETGNHFTLERQQPSMGLVVGAITIPLIIVEVFLVASAYASKKPDSEEVSQKLWVLLLADKVTFLLQKIIQAIIYNIMLRYKIMRPNYIENAQFYFKTLSFFNLIEWVDSQVNEDSDVQLSGAESVYGAWFDVFSAFYKALIIDYRLLCSLLFLEHSLEDDADGDTGATEEPAARNLTISERKYRSLGFMLGFTSLSAPICCALYYVAKLAVPAWVHMFSIIVNLAIIGFGVLFLRNNDLNSQELNKGSSGVKIMVSCLGAVGFTCWMVKATIAGYWAVTADARADIVNPSYISWVAAKFSVRGITTAFLMGLFLKVDARTMPLNNLGVKLNHFLVPVLMLTVILGTFLETLVDQYVGPLDSRLSCEIKEVSLNILFDAGPPMYLGFLIHVFLHFVIIQTKIAKQPPVRTSAVPDYGTVNYSVIS